MAERDRRKRRSSRNELLATRPGRIVAACMAAVALAVLAGIVALWPGGGPAPAGGELPTSTQAEPARVIAVSASGCESYAGPGCRVVDFELLGGPHAGEQSFLALSDELFAPELSPGDEIRVVPNVTGQSPATTEGPELDQEAGAPYSFDDFERTNALAYLALGFVVLVIAFGRRQGARSLLGLGAGLAIVLAFVVPAILAGRPPLLVSIVGGMGVVLVATLLTHGLGYKSAAAILGMAGALVLTGLLAAGAVGLADLTGQSSEQARLLLAGSTSGLSLSGVVVAGMVIGALGVLDDVTVSQSSTVLALRRADPAMAPGRLFAEGMRVGRDHLGATINTLVLAYAGAGLPVLLIFGTEGTSLLQAIRQEEVAQEIVAMLVGSIGLIAAVPLTTALAALLAVRVPARVLPADAHAHTH